MITRLSEEPASGLSAEQRAALLSAAGIDPHAPSTVPTFDPKAWGFPRSLPDAAALFESHARRCRRRAAAPQEGVQDGAQEEEETFLEALQQSRTFQSPDCVDSQAEAYGAAAELRCLRGSLVDGAGPREEDVTALRSRVKGLVAAAWSNEALRRGVALAKAGDAEGAMPCYNQAISLWPSNADAFVARGAALANQSDLQQAAEDLEAALELDPGHANATRYLSTVRARAAAAGLALRPRAARQAEAVPEQREEAERPAAPAAAPAPAEAAREPARSGSSSPSASSSGGSDVRGRAGSAGAAPEGGGMDLASALQVFTKHYSKSSSKKSSRKEEREKKKKHQRHSKKRRRKDDKKKPPKS